MKLTKKQIVDECKELFASDNWRFDDNDSAAKREYFDHLIDTLVRSNRLPERAYDWVNPF